MTLIRPALLAAVFLLPLSALPQEVDLAPILENAETLEPLETVMVAVDGKIIAERGYAGHTVDEPTNIKSASKTVVSALVGIAIDKGLIDGVDQKISDFLSDDFPEDADPRLNDVTVGNLLSMQAGLAPTSGPNYGRWVASRNWVREALDQPFETDPGGRMLYSTGSTHLLSAILTKASGESSLALAREWFGAVDDFGIGGWERDPQGIYLGGNQMAMSPRSLLAFGEVYRTGGLAPDGSRVLSAEWVEQSWTERTNSRFTGDGYGYGWFLREIGGEDVRYAWGYGGQMLYIVPSLDLTVVMTSDENSPSAGNGHRDALHTLLAEIIGAVRDEDEVEASQPQA
ncbi:beta-lactamase family protein [Devosia sp. BK]|uniref:serine hydrolase domain-containing protein n=1 Tax=Devosia sp. BK TaxID=2871706 RepID=UPI00293A16B8|nr:serine hydrolase [Devosia sp. BK]MDV3250879.1 beta-lactamase family protein [Devosia sp. BK]